MAMRLFGRVVLSLCWPRHNGVSSWCGIQCEGCSRLWRDYCVAEHTTRIRGLRCNHSLALSSHPCIPTQSSHCSTRHSTVNNISGRAL
ncbi:hypothetical protein EV126DRAFT_422773 [Verticillium dahliae]|nr:hypothetical protein EV126DRAFT_422773 [Verticillium dahliae]